MVGKKGKKRTTWHRKSFSSIRDAWTLLLQDKERKSRLGRRERWPRRADYQRETRGLSKEKKTNVSWLGFAPRLSGEKVKEETMDRGSESGLAQEGGGLPVYHGVGAPGSIYSNN